MAVFIKATYSKKLGLPQYSSHQYTVEVSAELTDLNQLSQASANLYARLQAAVDGQIVHSGHVPGETPSPTPPARPTNGASRSSSPPTAGDRGGGEDPWKCSDKQRDLILKIVDEHRLDKNAIDALARQRFGLGVKQLNELQVSSLIDELIETHGRAETPGRRGDRQPSYAGRSRR